MKAPSSELLFYAAVLLGGAGYLVIRLPTAAAEYQGASAVVAACAAVEALLLLTRFRWSPELFVALALFLLGSGVVRGLTDGFTGARLGIIAGGVAALFGYPILRREIRGHGAPAVGPSGAVDPGRDVAPPDA